jgi:hypothetical protein
MSQGPDPTNILRLYEELGVRPDQGVEQLTRRYRQRLHELHPDSQYGTADSSGQQPSVDDSDGLGWLTRSYREALAFERAHGRLPGAGQAGHAGQPAPPIDSGPAPVTHGPLPPRRGRRRQPPPARMPPASGRRWLLGLAVLLLLILALSPELELDAPEPPPPASRDRTGLPAAAAPAAGIRIGSSEAEVLHVQGEPHLRSDTLWEYGPSWVRFENGRVQDWHNSPLHPLKVATR